MAHHNSPNVRLPLRYVNFRHLLSQQTALQNSTKQLFTRVAKFSVCDDTECPFSRAKHLLVRLNNVEVRGGNAVAISYTWGSFDRRQIVLGHELDEAPVYMKLGSEWIVPDLATTLVSLTTEKEACWIDQLSIPQKDEEIRQALATIPLIYRTFDVVAVMPGRPCECLTQALLLAERAESASNETERTEYLESFRRLTSAQMFCLNAGSCSSYFDRMWTRQELMYSKRINIVWTSKQKPKCVDIMKANWPAEDISFEDLNPYGAAFLANQRVDRAAVYAVPRLMAYHTQFMSSGASMLVEYGGRPQLMKAEMLLFRFLGEQVITSGLPDPTQQDDHQALQSFTRQLGLAANSVRSATQGQDYVAAIWVDCPRYRLPESYKSMPLADLIQDAFDQLRKNFGVTLPSNAPNGLFEERGGSGVWNPKYYVQRVDALSLKHVYGTLGGLNLQPIPLVGQCGLPLSFLSSNARALSLTKVANYEDIVSVGVSEFSVKMMLNLLQVIASNWPYEVADRWGEDFANRIGDGATGKTLEHDEFLFEYNILSKNPDAEAIRSYLPGSYSDRIQKIEEIEEIDHHPIVYRMVTTILGLDENVCRQHGLKLILTPKAIGLSRRAISDDFSLHGRNKTAPESFITVALEESQNDLAQRLVEAERIAGGGNMPRYRVFAIWVPSLALNESGICAVVREGATDAILD